MTLPLLLAFMVTGSSPARLPIALHPANPHYFSFRGKPTVLITSGEHYGAVLNLDFDYRRYLDSLKKDGLNLTRTFSGVYREIIGNFNIKNNTLAPKTERYIGPWPRTNVPGARDGLAKFELTKFDEAYFKRLKDFIGQAGRRGIVVELVLFCPFYEDSMWNVDPMNVKNNVNGIGNIPRTDVYTLKYPDLVAVHDALVRSIIRELRDFDNLYYEICNEPYFGGVTLDWQHHVADTIVDAEKVFPAKHLIAQNIANGSAKVTNPHAAVSIFNFHYAAPPDAVRENWALNKPIAFDETGFKGSEDKTYRAQAWHFLLAGGAVFDNLDYSFTPAHPDGTALAAPPTPGGGSQALRSQLSILKRFIESFEFLRMAPGDGGTVRELTPGTQSRCLAERGMAYAIYFQGGPRAAGVLDLPSARYQMEWINTHTGQVVTSKRFSHKGGGLPFQSPDFEEDIALRLVDAKYPRDYESREEPPPPPCSIRNK